MKRVIQITFILAFFFIYLALFISIYTIVSYYIYYSKYEGIDNYYTDMSGFDYLRMPLFKPFELMKIPTSGPPDWTLHLSDYSSDVCYKNFSLSSFSPVDSIFCIDSCIYAHQYYFNEGIYNSPELWIFIDGINDTLIVYDKRNDFIKNHQNAKNMQPVSYYFSIYEEKVILPWFNDSIKTIINNKINSK